jgi:sRNA-binding protein
MNRYEADDYIKLLAEHYPKAFFETTQRRLPLKSDINVDLKERGPITNPVIVDDVLYFYTDHIGYHYATKAGASRVDLDGKVVAKVTAAEQREAEQRIADIRVMMEERKKQQANGDDDFVEEKPRRRAVIPATVLPSDEQALFTRIENLVLKARSLRMENEDFGAELSVKALELVRAAVDKLIEKVSTGNDKRVSEERG